MNAQMASAETDDDGLEEQIDDIFLDDQALDDVVMEEGVDEEL